MELSFSFLVTLLFLLIIIIFVFILFKGKIFFFSYIYIWLKKKRFISKFLSELNELTKNYKFKDTELIFHFENKNRTNILYNKLSIFGNTYPIEVDKPLTVNLSLMITPAPKKPMPVTAAAAIRVSS